MPVLTPIVPFPEANGEVRALLVYKGILYVAGGFTFLGGLPRNGIGAIDIATHTVTAFDPMATVPAATTVNCITVNNDILYFGTAAPVVFVPPQPFLSSFTIFAFAVDINGVFQNWDPSLNDYVFSMDIGPNLGTGPLTNLIYIAGNFSESIGAVQRNFVCAVTPTNILDGFNPDVNNTVRVIKARGSTIFFAGDFSTVHSNTTPIPRNYAAAASVTPFDHSGTITPWNPDPDSPVNNILFFKGYNWIGGEFNFLNGGTISQNGLAATDNFGNFVPLVNDPNFTDGSLLALVVYNNGLAFGGSFTTAGGQPRVGFATLNPDYSLSDIDANLDSDAQSIAFSLSPAELYLGGFFTSPRNLLAAFTVTSPPFPPATFGLPAAPTIQFLNRNLLPDGRTLTVFKWNPVFRDVNNIEMMPDFYRIYRTSKLNLEDPVLIAEISTLDIRGFVDTVFTEEIDGFFKYCVSAVNIIGEGGKSCATSVGMSQSERIS